METTIAYWGHIRDYIRDYIGIMETKMQTAEDELRERRRAIPKARPLNFQLTLTQQFV